MSVWSAWVTTRRDFVRHGMMLAGSAMLSPLITRRADGYICPPCGCAMDGRVFDAPGKCPACGMTLIAQQDKPLPFEPTELSKGRGAFATSGGVGHESHRITVAYYVPSRFRPEARVLLVLPGASRDAMDYREPWIERAEKANVLVAVLGYPESQYDFAAYQMGGIIRNLELRNVSPAANGELPAVLHLRDEDIRFIVNTRRESWLFHDFDRIFGLLVRATGSKATHYDMFGHSAGAQILHRLALFHSTSKANRLMAANAGLYTMPMLDEPQLIGLGGTGVTSRELNAAFGARLHLLLGELDNDGERGGNHLHTPKFDRYGIGRLDRGKSFFAEGQRRAKDAGVAFNWQMDIVPGVGHDHERMGAAAAHLLYGT